MGEKDDNKLTSRTVLGAFRQIDEIRARANGEIDGRNSVWKRTRRKKNAQQACFGSLPSALLLAVVRLYKKNNYEKKPTMNIQH